MHYAIAEFVEKHTPNSHFAYSVFYKYSEENEAIFLAGRDLGTDAYANSTADELRDALGWATHKPAAFRNYISNAGEVETDGIGDTDGTNVSPTVVHWHQLVAVAMILHATRVEGHNPDKSTPLPSEFPGILVGDTVGVGKTMAIMAVIATLISWAEWVGPLPDALNSADAQGTTLVWMEIPATHNAASIL